MEYTLAKSFCAASPDSLFEREKYFSEVSPGVWAAEGAVLPSTINMRGTNSRVYIGSGADCTGASVVLSGDRSLVVFGAGSTFRRGRLVMQGMGSKFRLGAFTTTAELTVTVASGRSVVIGDEGMFSNRVTIDTSDGHGIYDMSTGERINDSRDVTIGKHVWLGRDVRVSKGASIGEGSIVGQGGLVTGSKCATPNAVYSGTPATLRRESVVWSRMQAESLTEMEASERHRRYRRKLEALRSRCD